MLNLGITGANVQSWNKRNARELLARIFADNPKAGEIELWKLFRPEAEEYIEEILRYWFTNNLRSLQLAAQSSEPKVIAARVRKSAAGVAAALPLVAAKVREIALLDIVQPNGKRLGDCTGPDCVALAETVGPWLRRIGEKVKPGKTVGDSLGENEVVALWRLSLSKAAARK
jgi:hypothetical protein